MKTGRKWEALNWYKQGSHAILGALSRHKERIRGAPVPSRGSLAFNCPTPCIKGFDFCLTTRVINPRTFVVSHVYTRSELSYCYTQDHCLLILAVDDENSDRSIEITSDSVTSVAFIISSYQFSVKISSNFLYEY